MKKSLLLFLLALVVVAGEAQENNKPSVKLYGFIRNYIDFDTRENLSSNSDQFNMIPKDESLNKYGDDLNERSDIHLLSITTRLGLNITGPEFLGAKTSAKIETDLAGFGTSNTVLRIRQAYAKLDWSSDNLLVGQAWHPMMGDMMPDVFSLATGAPFTPFSRTPQIRYNHLAGKFTFTATAMYQFQYLSYGPSEAKDDDGNVTYSSATSFEYARKAVIPELYVQVMYKNGGFMAGAGVDMLTLKPRNEYIDNSGVRVKSKENVIGFTPTLFASYKDGGWGLKGRVTYARNASHLNMLGGYAVTKIKDSGEWEYGTLNSLTAWLDVTYKQKLKSGAITYCLFGGYGKNYGCNDDIADQKLMFIRGYKNVDSFWRVAPSVLYTQDAMQIGLEYEPTTVGYGTMNSDGSVEKTHSVTNHRICVMMKYNF